MHIHIVWVDPQVETCQASSIQEPMLSPSIEVIPTILPLQEGETHKPDSDMTIFASWAAE